MFVGIIDIFYFAMFFGKSELRFEPTSNPAQAFPTGQCPKPFRQLSAGQWPRFVYFTVIAYRFWVFLTVAQSFSARIQTVTLRLTAILSVTARTLFHYVYTFYLYLVSARYCVLTIFLPGPAIADCMFQFWLLMYWCSFRTVFLSSYCQFGLFCPLPTVQYIPFCHTVFW